MRLKLITFICLTFNSNLYSQDLCPPIFTEAIFYDEKIELSWMQSNDFGDLLYDECFSDCSTAIDAMTIIHVDSCGACSGGWFRYSDGTNADCGEGMWPCEDGGSDTYSAYAGYSGIDSTVDAYATVDSRLITQEIDLTNYTAAYLEFNEAYSYPEDATDSNMVEISVDEGETWDVIHVSNPWDVGEFYVFNTLDISPYSGNLILIAFRYYDSIGYGESWFIDDVKVWGSEEGQGDQMGSLCGTFLNYNIYMDGEFLNSTSSQEFMIEGLTNGVEYCFQISSNYEEGESELNSEVCSVPLGPFQIGPLNLNFEAPQQGSYEEKILTIQNFDTLNASYQISSVELSNIEAALDLLYAPMDESLGPFMDEEGIWAVGDSSEASSTYFPVPIPEDGGSFAYYNDDAAGETMFSSTPMLTSNQCFSGTDPSFLVFDLFFPNPVGGCESGADYADDFSVLISTDDGTNWTLIDNSMETGVWFWASYMYNLEPYVSNYNSFKVGFQYSDCNAEWSYGVALDNVAVKMGDSFTWLTVSPYKGTANYAGGYNDSMTVKVGSYGVYEDFTIEDELLVESGESLISIQLGVGVEVEIDNPNLIPIKFNLYQNYPNPFNPKTNIKIDVAESSLVKLTIFNVAGQKLVTLLDKKLNSGNYNIVWSGKSDDGNMLPSGIYFYEMKSLDFHSVKKLILLK
jgi:hypothetical protein